MSQTDPQQFDPLDPDVISDVYRWYGDILDETPVLDVDGIGAFVCRYSDVQAMALDTVTFSSSISGDDKGPRHMGISSEPVPDDVEEILARSEQVENALFTADPPVHTRHRSLVNKAFTPRRVREMEPRITEIANDLVDRFIDRGSFEMIGEYAVPLPLTVIAEALGVSGDDHDLFKKWSDDMISGNLDMLDNDRRREVAASVVEFHAYFMPLMDARRSEPRNDLLSDLVNARVAGEEPLRNSELFPIISQILLAGNETTTNLLGNGLVLLCQRPELAEELRGDPGLIPNFVEEVLRWDSPVHFTFRRVTADTEIGGCPVTAGSMVVPGWGPANYDPSVFEDPATFDLHRENARMHLSFGHGPHFCAGAPLARAEGRIGFETLLARLDDLSLVDPDGLVLHPSFSTRGFRRIDVSCSPSTR